MPIKIALVISVVLQFITAIIALSLIKRTRTQIAWWIISAGFLLMAFRRLFELLEVFESQSRLIHGLLNTWTGVAISIIMLLSLLYIKRIFNIQDQIEDLRKKNESRILSAIIETEEKERQYFARELHEGLGPLLSSVKMAISAFNKNLLTKKDIRIMDNAENLIDESINTLKEISNKLSPHILNSFGLLKAVQSFINKLQIAKVPRIKLNSNIEDRRFSYNIEVVIYRVICEMINNTLRHAKANNIYIDLLLENELLKVTYIDDGIGFDPDTIELEQKGMGYSNIKSRIRSLNGTFQIFSQPNEGLHVEIGIKIGQ